MIFVRSALFFLAKNTRIQIRRSVSSFRFVDLQVDESSNRRPKPKGQLLFGHQFSDHMLTICWSLEHGWDRPHIREFGPISILPSIKALHYGVSAFEGFKVLRGTDGKSRIFRPKDHVERFRDSINRICLPDFNSTELVKCIQRLVQLDESWVPSGEGESLYIRPIMFGTDPTLGVDVSANAMLCVMLCPVGSYFKSGQVGVTLHADPQFVRSWQGGCGSYKLSSNYAPTLYVQKIVREAGYQTSLWLYGPDELITEAGTMNIFIHWINENGEEELVTPPLNGLILPGITRKSVLEIAHDWDEFLVSEREVTMRDLLDALESGRVRCVFGTGTACVITHVARLVYKDRSFDVPCGTDVAQLSVRIQQTVNDIQRSEHAWMMNVFDEK